MVGKNCDDCHENYRVKQELIFAGIGERRRPCRATRRPCALLAEHSGLGRAGRSDDCMLRKLVALCCRRCRDRRSRCSGSLTIPQTVPASALPPHTPDLANGKTMFYAGGCASCHAVPSQDDKTRLGGGLALNSPFGTFYVAQYFARSEGRHRRLERSAIRHRADARARRPTGEHYYPAFPYTSYQRMRFDDLRDLFAYLKTLPAVPGRVRDHDLPFPFNIRRALGLLEAAVPRRRAVPARSVANRRSGIAAPIWSTARPLRRMSFAAQYSRRRHREPALRRRAEPGRPGRGSQHHPVQAQATGRRPISPTLLANRHDAGCRPGRRRHGRGGAQHLAADRRRPRGDGDLHQVAAGGRRPAPPKK